MRHLKADAIKNGLMTNTRGTFPSRFYDCNRINNESNAAQLLMHNQNAVANRISNLPTALLDEMLQSSFSSIETANHSFSSELKDTAQNQNTPIPSNSTELLLNDQMMVNVSPDALGGNHQNQGRTQWQKYRRQYQKRRNQSPEEKKRRNEMSRKCREKRRLNEALLKQLVVNLTRENYILQMQKEAVKYSYNICVENLINANVALSFLPSDAEILKVLLDKSPPKMLLNPFQFQEFMDIAKATSARAQSFVLNPMLSIPTILTSTSTVPTNEKSNLSVNEVNSDMQNQSINLQKNYVKFNSSTTSISQSQYTSFNHNNNTVSVKPPFVAERSISNFASVVGTATALELRSKNVELSDGDKIYVTTTVFHKNSENKNNDFLVGNQAVSSFGVLNLSKTNYKNNDFVGKRNDASSITYSAVQLQQTVPH